MSDLPLVSIIMSVYNGEEYIKQAIDSVKRQTYSNWELLVTDDCSTDSTPDILEYYSINDSRIKYSINSCNMGLTYNLSELCKKAKGTYVARLDSDDICREDRLKKQVDVMVNENCDIVVSYAKGIGSKSNLLKTDKDGDVLRASLLFFNPIVHSSVMFKNDGTFNYNPSFLKSQDYELWERMASQKKIFKVIPEPLVYFRFHAKQISHNFVNEQIVNTDIIRKRAIHRICDNIPEEKSRVFFDWFITKKLSSLSDYFAIKKVFLLIKKANDDVGIYDSKSLSKVIDCFMAELIACKIQNNAEKIPVHEIIYFLFHSFSFRILRIYMANVYEKRGMQS